MKTLTLNIPEELNLDSGYLLRFLASKLYEDGKLSLGQAAEFAGMPKKDFAEILGDFNVSIFNYAETEIADDLSNA